MTIARKTMRRDEWRAIEQKDYAQKWISRPGFAGYVALLRIQRARQPLYVGENRLCVMGPGISWLEIAPQGGYWFATVMFDGQGRLFQYYFDLTDGNRVEADGMVWFDDLFLDIIHTPGACPRMEDLDELEQALQSGLISRDVFDRTLREGRALTRGLLQREEALRRFCEEQKAQLEPLLKRV